MPALRPHLTPPHRFIQRRRLRRSIFFPYASSAIDYIETKCARLGTIPEARASLSRIFPASRGIEPRAHSARDPRPTPRCGSARPAGAANVAMGMPDPPPMVVMGEARSPRIGGIVNGPDSEQAVDAADDAADRSADHRTDRSRRAVALINSMRYAVGNALRLRRERRTKRRNHDRCKHNVVLHATPLPVVKSRHVAANQGVNAALMRQCGGTMAIVGRVRQNDHT